MMSHTNPHNELGHPDDWDNIGYRNAEEFMKIATKMVTEIAYDPVPKGVKLDRWAFSVGQHWLVGEQRDGVPTGPATED